MGTFGAVAGDAVIFAYDPEGRWLDGPTRIWDASSGREPGRVLENYAVLTEIAEGGLASACRDVSNAGLPGTLAMLADASGCRPAWNWTGCPVRREWRRTSGWKGFPVTASSSRLPRRGPRGLRSCSAHRGWLRRSAERY